MIEILKEGIVSVLNKKYPEIVIPNFDIEIPTDKTRTDYVCTVSFLLAKGFDQNPFVIAEGIVNFLNENQKLLEQASFSAVMPGFINIEVTDLYLAESTKKILELGENFGKNLELKGEKWVVEHTSPNPNKAMHIGHLRNNLVGMSVAKILEANGAEVICDAVDNDRGIAIIKAMWGYLVYKNRAGIKDASLDYWFLNQNDWITPLEAKIKADHFVGECYLFGAEDFKTNPESEKKMREMLLAWEAKDEKTRALWQKILDYAHEGIEETLERLGNRWDKVWHEHEHYDLGKELVLKGLADGILKKTDEGAVLTQLESYHIPDTVALRSDGTSLYLTQDIGLTKLKKEFYQADKLVWVIGPEQGMAMKQLFAVCEQLGIGSLADFFHIPYGLVTIKDAEGKIKKMSSRDGDTILIDDLIDNLKEQLIKERPNYTDEEAEKISLAAIKFMILKSGRMVNVTFDTEASLRLDGASGVYILYAYARMCSLLEKEKMVIYKKISFSRAEKEVLVNVSYLPLVVKNMLKDFSPQNIAEYLIELCQSFNSLYASEKFINEDNEEETSKKLLLAKACSIAILNSLKILGIVSMNKI